MSEKKGNTGKLNFNFDPSSILEVQFNSDDKWFRVTAEYFRSFDGKRRIGKWGYVNSFPYFDVQDYCGPLYIWGTNILSQKLHLGKIVTSKEYENFLETSRRRSAY
jgi:hypothetical protein